MSREGRVGGGGSAGHSLPSVLQLPPLRWKVQQDSSPSHCESQGHGQEACVLSLGAAGSSACAGHQVDLCCLLLILSSSESWLKWQVGEC